MKPILISLSVILFWGCSSSDLNKQTPIQSDDRTCEFQWFDLGKDENEIVDSLFHIAIIEISFKDNGYHVYGTIWTISSMTITKPIVECSIKDSTVKEGVITGSSVFPRLDPAAAYLFDVFIPTTKTNVSEVGVLVRDYRK